MTDDAPRHLAPVPNPDGTDGPVQSNDPRTERAVIGLCLDTPGLIHELHHLTPGDFYRPEHEWIWGHLERLRDAGQLITPTIVHAELQQHPDDYRRHGGATYLFGLHQDATTEVAATAPYLASILKGHTRTRRLANLATQLSGLTHTDDHDTALAEAVQLTEDLFRDHLFGGHTRLHVPDVDEFLNQDDAAYHWLVPGILERGDRVILTGGEGSGKSTLGRQIGIQTAAGIHPFTGDPITPLRVLLLDLENSEAQLRRELGKLRAKAGRQLEPGLMHVQSRISGLDLVTEPDDRAWLRDLLAATKPDLLITGPIYKMAGGNPNAEEDTKPVALYLDRLRAEYGTAIWLEAHVGNEQAGSKKRPERPVGWSGWRRWPEFGLFLGPEGDLLHWRGDRDRRDWPARLVRTGTWPWSAVDVSHPKQWIAIAECIENAGEMLSNREIAKRTGISSSTVDRRVKEHSQEYQGLLYRYGNPSEDQ